MAVDTKTLMILGAGPFQAPAIEKAAAMGARVISVDYLPDNVGHRYSHQSVNCSTVDKEGVLQAAVANRVDGVCTFSSDVAISSVAYVCEKLGLPGASPHAAETMATKHRFRTFLREAALPCPRFVSGNAFEEVFASLGDLRLPIVFKPVDTSGSRGISRLDSFERRGAEAAYQKAQAHSRCGTVCVEEFVPGVEVGGDAILIGGRVAFVAITHKHLLGFVVTGHSLPTNISRADQARVVQSIETICGALGYSSGPLNFDAIVSPDAVTMLEMSARNGGNGIAAVIERATGVDVEKATIALALGSKPQLPAHPEVKRGAGSFVFGSPVGGTLLRMSSVEELKRSVPEVFHAYFVRQIGDAVGPFEHNGNLIGFALFDCDGAAEYDRVTEAVRATLDIAVGPR